MIQRIDELDALPVVGEFYLVPHLRIQHSSFQGYMPVLGSLHIDRELAPDVPKHYHIDTRFALDKNYLKRAHIDVTCDNKTSIVISEVNCKFLGITYSRKKCRNTIAGINMPPGYRNSRVVKWYSKFEEADIRKTMRCPHLGYNLKQCPAQDGIIECPLHGLQFRLDTGKLVPFSERIMVSMLPWRELDISMMEVEQRARITVFAWKHQYLEDTLLWYARTHDMRYFVAEETSRGYHRYIRFGRYTFKCMEKEPVYVMEHVE